MPLIYAIILLLTFMGHAFAQDGASTPTQINEADEIIQGLFHLKRAPKSQAKFLLGGVGLSNEDILINQAKQYMLGNKKILSITSADDLVFEKSTKDRAGGRHLHFRRVYRGIDVDKMTLIVHFNHAQQITSFNGYIDIIAKNALNEIDDILKSKTQVSPQEALDFIAQDLNQNSATIAIIDSKPLIIAENPYLLWQLDIGANSIRYLYRTTYTKPIQILSKQVKIRY